MGEPIVEELLSQPVQVIVGGRRGTTKSFEDGAELRRRAPNGAEFIVIDGAGHYDTYDTPEYVDAAADALASFFHQHIC